MTSTDEFGRIRPSVEPNDAAGHRTVEENRLRARLVERNSQQLQQQRRVHEQTSLTEGVDRRRGGDHSRSNGFAESSENNDRHRDGDGNGKSSRTREYRHGERNGNHGSRQNRDLTHPRDVALDVQAAEQQHVFEGSIIRGRVIRIEPYGAFLDYHTHRRPGLLHISQMAPHRVDNVTDIVQLGQQIFCRVVEIDETKTRLSMVGINQNTGELDVSQIKPSSHPTRGRVDMSMERRAEQRRLYWNGQGGRRTTWHDDPDPTVNRLLWAVSPDPPITRKRSNTPSLSPSGSGSCSASSSSSSDSSSSSSSSSSRPKKRHRSDHRGKKRSGKRNSRKRPRRRSSSSSSSSSSSDSSSSSSSPASSSSSSTSEGSKSSTVSAARVGEGIPPEVIETGITLDENTLREAQEFKKVIQRKTRDSDDDEDDIGPQPLPHSNAALDAAGNAKSQNYGKALLPGEGQALAQYVQQNLRIPRRGEIGFSGDQIEQWENSGFVMSGSRHTRMNAVRLRKENQIYSAEEQRALALITMEEKKQKEAALVEDFRKMLKEKQDQRNSRAGKNSA